MNGGSRPDENPSAPIDTIKQYKGATRNRFQILTKIYLDTNQPETISESLAWFTLDLLPKAPLECSDLPLVRRSAPSIHVVYLEGVHIFL